MPQPHYYLAILGADPLFQRRARAVPRSNRCSTAATPKGRPPTSKTQKEENLAYYARHAFDTVRKLEVKGVPPIWTMIRKPR